MIRRPPGYLGSHPLKAQLRQIELINKYVNHLNGIVLIEGSRPPVSATLTTIAFYNSSLRLLESAPDCRPRRVLLHLSYSCVSPYGPAILVTHGQYRKWDESRASRKWLRRQTRQ